MIRAYFYGDKQSSGNRELLEIRDYMDFSSPRRLTKRMYDNILLSARSNISYCSDGLVDIMIFENDHYLFHITYFVITFDDGDSYGYILIDSSLIRSFKVKGDL